MKTFDFDRLWRVADRARSQPRLDREEVAWIRDEAPKALASFPRAKPPATIRHPAGFSLSGAPVRTFMKSALLLAGQKALGRRYGGSLFYETVEKELALGIMRSHFHHGSPKGTYCCILLQPGHLPRSAGAGHPLLRLQRPGEEPGARHR